MANNEFTRQVFRQTISMVCGFDPTTEALGGTRVDTGSADALQARIGATLKGLAEGSPERDLAAMRWSVQTALYEAEQALDGVLQNLPVRPAAALLRLIVFPFGPRMTPPSDRLGAKVARSILFDGADAGEVVRELMRRPPRAEFE